MTSARASDFENAERLAAVGQVEENPRKDFAEMRADFATFGGINRGLKYADALLEELEIAQKRGDEWRRRFDQDTTLMEAQSAKIEQLQDELAAAKSGSVGIVESADPPAACEHNWHVAYDIPVMAVHPVIRTFRCSRCGELTTDPAPSTEETP